MSSGAVVVVGEAALEREYPYVYAQAQFPHLLVGKRVVVAGLGKGLILDFTKGSFFQDSLHTIDFRGTTGTLKLLLRRRSKLRWNSGLYFRIMSDAEAEAEAALDGAAQVEELRKQLDAVSAALHASQSSHHQEVESLRASHYAQLTNAELSRPSLALLPSQEAHCTDPANSAREGANAVVRTRSASTHAPATALNATQLKEATTAVLVAQEREASALEAAAKLAEERDLWAAEVACGQQGSSSSTHDDNSHNISHKPDEGCADDSTESSSSSSSSSSNGSNGSNSGSSSPKGEGLRGGEKEEGEVEDTSTAASQEKLAALELELANAQSAAKAHAMAREQAESNLAKAQAAADAPWPSPTKESASNGSTSGGGEGDNANVGILGGVLNWFGGGGGDGTTNDDGNAGNSNASNSTEDGTSSSVDNQRLKQEVNNEGSRGYTAEGDDDDEAAAAVAAREAVLSEQCAGMAEQLSSVDRQLSRAIAATEARAALLESQCSASSSSPGISPKAASAEGAASVRSEIGADADAGTDVSPVDASTSAAAKDEAAALRRQVTELKAARAAAELAAASLRDELSSVKQERESQGSLVLLPSEANERRSSDSAGTSTNATPSSAVLEEHAGSAGDSDCMETAETKQKGDELNGGDDNDEDSDSAVRRENEALRLRLTEVESKHAELLEQTEAQQAAAAATAEYERMMAATAAFQDELLSELGRGSDDDSSIVDDDDHDHDHDQDDDIKSQEPEAPSLADGASNTYCPPSPSVRDYERMLAATSSFNEQVTQLARGFSEARSQARGASAARSSSRPRGGEGGGGGSRAASRSPPRGLGAGVSESTSTGSRGPQRPTIRVREMAVPTSSSGLNQQQQQPQQQQQENTLSSAAAAGTAEGADEVPVEAATAAVDTANSEAASSEVIGEALGAAEAETATENSQINAPVPGANPAVDRNDDHDDDNETPRRLFANPDASDATEGTHATGRVTNVNNNNNADGDEDERSSRSREASLARLASLTEQTTALDQGRRRLSVIEKDLNAALDQQRAASLARSSHKNNNSKGKGKSKGKHASSNAFDSSNGGDGGDGGDGGNEEDGEGEGGGEDEEMDSKVAALVDELAAARRAHEDTETRLQREVEALRTQVMMLASANVDLEAGAQFDTLARATAAYQDQMLTHGSPHSPRSPTSARGASIEVSSFRHSNDTAVVAGEEHGVQSHSSIPTSPPLNSSGNVHEKRDISNSTTTGNASDTPHGIGSPISSPIAVVRSPEEHGNLPGSDQDRQSSDRQSSGSAGRSRLNSADSDSPPRTALTYL